MHERDIRKPVHMPKRVFHISDDDGNTRDFVVRTSDKKVLFTVDDVGAVIDAALYVITDALKHGEEITVRGFGTLRLRHLKSRKMRHVETGEETVSEAHYIPKFVCGQDLRMSAKMYELSLSDMNDNPPDFDEVEGGE